MKSNINLASLFKLNLKSAAVLLFSFGLSPLSVHALGLGEMRISSSMGQPLKAEVDVVLDSQQEASSLVVRNASAEEYQRQGYGSRGPLASLRVVLQPSKGKSVALLNTRDALNDPYVYLILESFSGNGRVLRSYPMLLPIEGLKQSPASIRSAKKGLANPLETTQEQDRGFLVLPVKTSSPIASDASRLYENLIEVGQRPSSKNLQRVNGRGSNEPVAQILFKVVPKGWRGYASDVDVKTLSPLSWNAKNDYWITVLDSLMAQSSLSATVNWNSKEVTFRGLDPFIVLPLVETHKSLGHDHKTEKPSENSASSGAINDGMTASDVSKHALEKPKSSERIFSSGALSLEKVLRKIVPSNYSMLSNDQKSFDLPRLASVANEKDWKDLAKKIAASQGSSLYFDDEKKRVLVSFN